ncbi:hypothetical protein [Neisseria gonorrhoeae]|uniref:hypothetical protein n=1 Tax=Neisseria gonorrhoeae TaxID=485 RepID=UPI001E2C69EE|nr:hypothetical protein [Neisseria gonorrhoeae]
MPSRARKGGLLLQIVQNLPQQGSPAKARGARRGAGAMTAARLHGYIRAAHAACPILGAGLWTQPAGECA